MVIEGGAEPCEKILMSSKKRSIVYIIPNLSLLGINPTSTVEILYPGGAELIGEG